MESRAGTGKTRANAVRIAAGEIEPAVIATIVSALRDKRKVLGGSDAERLQPAVMKALVTEAARTADAIGTKTFAEQRAILLALGVRIAIGDATLEIHFRPSIPVKDRTEPDADPDSGLIVVVCPFSRAVRNGERVLVVEGPQTAVGGGLNASGLKAAARGFAWFEELVCGAAGSAQEIAKRENVTDRYVSRLIDFALDFAARPDAGSDL